MIHRLKGLSNWISKKLELLFWALLLGIALVLIVVYLLRPVVKQVLTVRRNYVQVVSKVKDSRQLISSMDRLQAENDSLKGEIKRNREHLAGEEDISQLLEILLAASKKCEVDFVSIKPGKESEKDRYVEFPFEITLKTQYPNLVKYLGGLEGPGSLIRVETVAISSEKAVAPDVEVKLEATAKFVR